MHEILRCSTCNAIAAVGKEHFYDAGRAWPCPACDTVIRDWVPVSVDLNDPFVGAASIDNQAHEKLSISAASAVSFAVA